MNSNIDHPRQTSIEPELPVSVAMDLLSDRRRRRTLLVLSSRPGPIPLDELAEALARDDTDSTEIETYRLELHHCHLPKLADAGLLRYNRETNHVSGRAPLSVIGPLLDAVRAGESAA